MEQISSEPSPQKNNSPNLLSSAELSGIHTTEIPTFQSVTSPEPVIVNLDDNVNDPTVPYGFEAQQPFVLLSVNELNLPANPFIILAEMTIVQQNPTQHDKSYSPQSPEPSEPSPISTPPMYFTTIDGWETPHITTDDTTFNLEDDPRHVHWTSPLDKTFHSEGEPRLICLVPSPSLPSPPHKLKRKLEMGMCFPKKGIVAACLRSLRTNDSPGKGHLRTVH